MSLTNDELRDRIVAIENVVNTIQTTMNNNIPSKKTLNNLVAILTKQLSDLEKRVAALESAVKTLQNA